MIRYVNHFRPIYETKAAVFWLLAVCLLPMSGMPYGWAFALFGLLVLAVRSLQIWKALKFRMAISTKWLTTLHVPKLLAIQQRMRDEANSMYLGIGYEWTQKHCQIAHDILRMPTTDIPGLPRWLRAERQHPGSDAARLVVDTWHGAEKGAGAVPLQGNGRPYPRWGHDRRGQDSHL
jgi:conjugal transfer pilus assembly protein TraD